MTSKGSNGWWPELLGEVKALRDENRLLREQNQTLKAENEQLKEKLDAALRGRFARKSERRMRVPRERPDPGEDADKPGHGRGELPAHLPRRDVEHDLTEEQRACLCCGKPRQCIGKTVAEQLDYEPPVYFGCRHIRHTYSCPGCEGPTEQRFSTAGPA